MVLLENNHNNQCCESSLSSRQGKRCPGGGGDEAFNFSAILLEAADRRLCSLWYLLVVSFLAFSSQLCSLQGNRSGAPHHQRLGHVVPSDRRMRAFSIHRKMKSPRQFEVPGGVASHTHSTDIAQLCLKSDSRCVKKFEKEQVK